MLISQDNLTIRNATLSDVPTLGKWWRDGEIMAHAGFPNGLNTTDEEIATRIASDTDETQRRLMIEADNAPIGEMNYRNKGDKTAAIGINICETVQQGKGCGSKLLRLLIGELFTNYGYEKIILDTNMNNQRAQRVYTKLGFRETERKYDNWTNQIGELQSTIYYEMTKDEFVK